MQGINKNYHNNVRHGFIISRSFTQFLLSGVVMKILIDMCMWPPNIRQPHHELIGVYINANNSHWIEFTVDIANETFQVTESGLNNFWNKVQQLINHAKNILQYIFDSEAIKKLIEWNNK